MKALQIGNLSAPVPIVQGGMGVGISLSGLAAAVAGRGGTGVTSAAGLRGTLKTVSKKDRAARHPRLQQRL